MKVPNDNSEITFLFTVVRENNPLFLLQSNIIIFSQVASLLHDDVLDDADTRRGIGSLNVVMGNKVCV